MRILTDENIPDEIVDILRKQGHNIIKPTAGMKDTAVALLAKEENRLLLTQDKDFSNILLYPPKQFSGIIRLKFHPPTIPHILSALDDLFQQFSQKELEKKLVILEKDGFRIR